MNFNEISRIMIFEFSEWKRISDFYYIILFYNITLILMKLKSINMKVTYKTMRTTRKD